MDRTQAIACRASVSSDRRAPTIVAPSARTLIVSGLSGCRLLRNGCRSNELLKVPMISTGKVFPRRRDQISDQHTSAAEVSQRQAEAPEPRTGDSRPDDREKDGSSQIVLVFDLIHAIITSLKPG
jgi:hypothetical protein